jgi:hypothetical protein
MNRDEYIMANIGDPVLVNGNAKESGTKANIVKFHNDRTGDGMYHGKIRVRFEDGSEKTYSHYFLTVFKKDMVEKKHRVPQLRVWWSDQFTGFYPVSTSAVVVAGTAERAAEILNHLLKVKGLPGDAKVEDMHEVKTFVESVQIINDGDY